MKLKDLPRALGWRSSPREYPYEVTTFELPRDGEVRFAQWQHPAETPKVITQESIDGLRSFLRDGDQAIDIGAHTGDSTLPVALAVGVHGLVFALEPNPYAFTVLAANAALNPGKARVLPLRFAATAADGQFDFEYSDAGYCNGGLHDGVARWRHGHFHRLRVDGRNLADYLRVHAPGSVPRIRYIKIDTEGHDRAVVRTLNELIQVARPFIKSEIYQHLSDEERDGYQADLLALGYRLFRFGGDAQYLGEPLERGDFRRWKHFDVFAVPRERADP